MDFNKVIEARRSIRSFKSKKADWKHVLLAIESALHAPMAGNNNPLKFIIVENPETIKKIAKFSEQSWISQAGIVVVICSDNTVLEKLYGDRGKIYCRQQAGAAIENFLLKITDAGLAACWIGAFTDELVEQLLRIPEHMRIEAIIPVGYAAEKPSYKRKHSLENAIFWEEYLISKRPTIFPESKIGRNPPTG
ncbi:MAG: nitroreductase family protein [archaeon]|nr:nitroreductase family protein [archaeon]